MPKLSAGIIVYRINTDGHAEILLVHPGGPFYKNKDKGAWSIPKGEYAEGEDALSAAIREFTEETGNALPEEGFIPLIPVKIKSGKIVSAWAVKANFKEPFIQSNFFEMEWPPASGKKQSFAETDKAEWFVLKEARQKINAGQTDLLDQLEEILSKTKENIVDNH
jgi:predicted NUDIX family NTP pyrophosphohydrolase